MCVRGTLTCRVFLLSDGPFLMHCLELRAEAGGACVTQGIENDVAQMFCFRASSSAHRIPLQSKAYRVIEVCRQNWTLSNFQMNLRNRAEKKTGWILPGL